MEFKKIGALTVVAMVAAGTILGHDERHIERRPSTPEAALLTDGAIISTPTFSTATTIQLPLLFSRISSSESGSVGAVAVT